MIAYKPLTKIIIDADGKRKPVCVHYGTETCRTIHSVDSCYGCPMLPAILAQLNAFETVYMLPDVEEKNANEHERSGNHHSSSTAKDS